MARTDQCQFRLEQAQIDPADRRVISPKEAITLIVAPPRCRLPATPFAIPPPMRYPFPAPLPIGRYRMNMSAIARGMDPSSPYPRCIFAQRP